MDRRKMLQGIFWGTVLGWFLWNFFIGRKREADKAPALMGKKKSTMPDQERIELTPSATQEMISLDDGKPVVSEEPAVASVEFTASAVETPVKPDDLTRIEGIGPKLDALLKENGILTFAQLGDVDPTHLQEILKASGHRLSMIDPASWPEQARLAAAGDWEGLKRLQDGLKGGRRVA